MNNRSLSLAVVILFCGCVFAGAQDDRTARTLYEKAAYAEEHERDLPQALSLYKEAAIAAQKQGDLKLADDARAGVTRITDRQVASAESGPSTRTAAVVEVRIYNLVESLHRGGELSEIKNQLVAFGAAAVPQLADVLRGIVASPQDRQMAAQGFRNLEPRPMNSQDAADVLGRIGTPEAIRALDAGLESPDLMVRRGVARALDPERQRALLDKAVRDPAEAVRSAAISRLTSINDPSLLELMKSAARTGQTAAGSWLGKYAPRDLLAILADRSIPAPMRTGLLSAIRDSSWGLSVKETATGLTAIAETANEALLARDTFNCVLDLLQSNRGEVLDQATGAKLEQSALTWVNPPIGRANADVVAPKAVYVLASFGGMTSADSLTAIIAKGLWPALHKELRRALATIVARQQPQDFPALLGFLLRLPPETLDEDNDALLVALGKVVEKGVSPAALAEGVALVSPAAKNAYFSRVLLMSERPLSSSLREAFATKDAAVRCGALARTDDPDLLPEVIASLGEPYSDTRDQAIAAFRRLVAKDSVRAKEALRGALETRPGTLGLAYFRALLALPSKEAIALIEDVWPKVDADRHEELASFVVAPHEFAGSGGGAGGGIVGPESVAFLIKNFGAFKSVIIRTAAIKRFQDTLSEPAIEIIGKALTDDEESVRAAARVAFSWFKAHREALAEFKAWRSGTDEAKATIAELMKLLESSNLEVVIGAVQSLGALKASSALPALVRLMERNEPHLNEAVRAAIAKIGG